MPSSSLSNERLTGKASSELSLSQKVAGRRLYLIFSMLNGAAIVCLAQDTLILYCLKCGVSEALIGVIASFMYLTTFFMLGGKQLVRAIGAARTISYCWLLRNTFAMLLLTAPLISRIFSPGLGTVVIMICAFGFFASRAAGMIGMQPLIGEIVSDDNRGKFLSDVFLFFCISNMVFMGLIILLFSYSNSITAFQLVIFCGASFGYASAFFIGRIRESGTPSLSASQPLLEIVSKVKNNKRYLKLLFAHCFATSGVVLVIPFSMMALKVGYDISNQSALIFAMIQMTGGISVSYLNRILAEETGPRPLLIIYFTCLIAIAVLWCLAPVGFVWYYFVPLFFLSGLSSMGIMLTLSHYFIVSIPPDKMVGVSLLIVASSGVITGLTGSIIGGGMMKILNSLMPDAGVTVFKVYFLVIVLLLICYFFVIIRLERIRDWHTGRVISLFFAPRDLRTLFLLNRLDSVTSPGKEMENIGKLESSRSELSEKKLLESLKSPKFTMRAKAMTALLHIPFGEDGENALMDELEKGQYATAYIAAQVLGEHKVSRALPLLKKYLHSDDPYLQSKCMLSLIQLNAVEVYDEIREIFRTTDNPRLLIHGANALVEMNDEYALSLMLDKLKQKELPTQVSHEIIYCISEVLGVGDDYYKFLKIYHNDKRKAADFAENLVEPLIAEHSERVRVVEHIEAYFARPEDCEVRSSLIMLMKPYLRINRESEILLKYCLDYDGIRTAYPELLFCLIFNLKRPDEIKTGLAGNMIA